MAASAKVDVNALKRLAAVLEGPTVRQVFENVVQEKALAAMIGQAIAENFENEGPGWAPLKASTIRASVSKAMRKRLQNLTDTQLLRREHLAHKTMRSLKEQDQLHHLDSLLFNSKKAKVMTKFNPMRKILQKTGLLKKSATMPFATGNIYKVEGTHIIWGTNLSYASVHQHGNAKKNIPARPFMDLSEKWKETLNVEVATRVIRYLKRLIREGLHK